MHRGGFDGRGEVYLVRARQADVVEPIIGIDLGLEIVAVAVIVEREPVVVEIIASIGVAGPLRLMDTTVGRGHPFRIVVYVGYEVSLHVRALRKVPRGLAVPFRSQVDLDVVCSLDGKGVYVRAQDRRDALVGLSEA
jgi:hypothetical protein